MNNPRGPMVPFEKRISLDRARLFRASANTLETLAMIVAAPDTYTRDALEKAVVDTENAIQSIQIEIRKMKDDSPRQ